MRVEGKDFRTIWLAADGATVEIIDQTKFPHRFEVVALRSVQDAAIAIKDMLVRGAPLIGATAAYGMALAMRQSSTDDHLARAYQALHETRPTAINLRWALDEMVAALKPLAPHLRIQAAYKRAAEICDEDVAINQAIGRNGLELIKAIAKRKKVGERINVLTHCNAGWLATVDWGTATAPIYMAYEAGLPIHVWVDETRPRNQGASLTAWELAQHGVPYTLIPDNTGGHLMQHGQVDLCIVGTDRTTAHGDVCNKIGTYLKALAAYDNDVPFYVALPSPTIDFRVRNGLKEIPIEQRSGDEVSRMTGLTADGRIETIEIAARGTPVANYAFDVTPSQYVTGLITERGVIKATKTAIAKAFPERALAEGGISIAPPAPKKKAAPKPKPARATKVVPAKAAVKRVVAPKAVVVAKPVVVSPPVNEPPPVSEPVVQELPVVNVPQDASPLPEAVMPATEVVAQPPVVAPAAKVVPMVRKPMFVTRVIPKPVPPPAPPPVVKPVRPPLPLATPFMRRGPAATPSASAPPPPPPGEKDSSKD